MIPIPANQRQKHPELYPILQDPEYYIKSILDLCDNVKHKKRVELVEVPRLVDYLG